MRRFQIWTDGACLKNPGGAGGWGCLLREEGGPEVEAFGHAPETTSNRIELMAAIQALEATPEGSVVHVRSDSRYLVDGMARWLPGWVRKGWTVKGGAPVKNADLWQHLAALAEKRLTRWTWVKGHSGIPENEQTDRLADAAARGLPV